MDLPPAIVLGIDTPIGLAVVRELGRRGVAIHGIAGDRRAVGLHSRYLRRAYMRPAGEEKLVALLNDIARESGARFLLTVSENDIALVNRQRGRLRGLKPLVPEAGPFAVVLDKERALAAARAVGLAIPETAQIAAAEEIAPLAARMRYPVILKWRNPPAVAPVLVARGLPLVKTEYCYDAEGLGAALGRYAPAGEFPLVQSFCPGYGLGQMVFMHRGEALLRFQHRRLHEWPPEGGVSTLCESLPPGANGALFEKSVALLRAIGWEGPAMVEFRFDPATGNAVFMEVNGRFWGSLPLAVHAGAAFAWLSYSVLGCGAVPAVPPYRVGLRCRYMIPELRRLFTILVRPGTIQNRALRFGKAATIAAFLAEFCRPSQRYFVFALDDPMPLVRDLLGALAKHLARLPLVKRLAWRSA